MTPAAGWEVGQLAVAAECSDAPGSILVSSEAGAGVRGFCWGECVEDGLCSAAEHVVHSCLCWRQAVFCAHSICDAGKLRTRKRQGRGRVFAAGLRRKGRKLLVSAFVNRVWRVIDAGLGPQIITIEGGRMGMETGVHYILVLNLTLVTFMFNCGTSSKQTCASLLWNNGK